LLALGMIELCFKAGLVLSVGFAALCQSRLTTAVLAAVSLTAVTRAADIKENAAPWPSTNPLAYLDVWQSGRAFEAGLDKGHQSWQARSSSTGWFLEIGAVRLRPRPVARLGPSSPLKDNKPTEEKRLSGGRSGTIGYACLVE